MIKPFKILETREEHDGDTGVTYVVQRTSFIDQARTEEVIMQGYMSVPKGADIDQFMFDELRKAGWF